jgi:hypothetical protein
MRHNEIRNITASLLEEVTVGVEKEPMLQSLTGEVMTMRSANTDDNSRLDIKCRGFWNSGQDAFFDVRVFNPLAPSHRSKSLSSVYQSNEKEKRRTYEQRIREVEYGSFTPLVMSATGGLAPAASVFYKKLASMIAMKRGHPYSMMVNLIRRHLAFSLLRSSIHAIRGSRSSHRSCIPIVPQLRPSWLKDTYY